MGSAHVFRISTAAKMSRLNPQWRALTRRPKHTMTARRTDKVTRKMRFRVTVANRAQKLANVGARRHADGGPSPRYTRYRAARGRAAAAAEN